MKVRIVPITGFTSIYEVQVERCWGWSKLYSGTYKKCLQAIEQLGIPIERFDIKECQIAVKEGA